MGNAIVYCEGCGTNLRENDFEKGGARLVDHRPFCAPCRPADPNPAPPARRSESTRVRRNPTTRVPVATTPPPARRAAPGPKVPFVLGMATGSVATLLLTFLLSSRPAAAPAVEKPVAEAPRLNPEPDPAAAAFLEFERSIQGKEPEAVLPLCERARLALRGTPFEPRLSAIERAAVDATLRQADETIQADSLFSRRTEVLRMLDAARRPAGPRASEVDRLRADYDQRFETAASRLAEFARTEAERLAAKTRLDDAVRKCDDYLESFGSTAHAGPVRKLRDDLDRRRQR